MNNVTKANDDKGYLELLSKQFRNIEEVAEEIINLQAILNLPKGTELYVSDIHGEYGSLSNLLNNGSGIIRGKISDCLEDVTTQEERRSLAILIYYPEEKLQIVKKQEAKLIDWYTITIRRLVEVAREVSSKYTRSKVRKATPEGFDYIIDELLNTGQSIKDKENYFNQIIRSIIELNRADDFIIAISKLIKRMAIDHLHIVGDIFNRGKDSKKVIDMLMDFHSLDIQWGNHDILWMGAALGQTSCIANVIRINSRYDNLDTLENGYGINLRPLALFAVDTYIDDPCKEFTPKTYEDSKYLSSDKDILAKIHKAISIIQFKIEGQLIMRRPEYGMESRLLLDRIDYDRNTIRIGNEEYKLTDSNFPTIDPKDPYRLTVEEAEVMERLQESFKNSEILSRHMDFLYSKGSLYKCFNSNLLFHACIPMEENGEFSDVSIMGHLVSGKRYLDLAEHIINKVYFDKKVQPELLDLFWYFWCGPKSPLYGRDQMTTFERYFIADKKTHKENKDPYFDLVDNEEICEMILREFGLEGNNSHIINGHVPVREKDGESPVKAGGMLLVIDGGFSKAYWNETGRFGYALIHNSYGLMLVALEPFDSKEKVISEEQDIQYIIMIDPEKVKRTLVGDTDIGKNLKQQIDELKKLLSAYEEGTIKEKVLSKKY